MFCSLVVLDQRVGHTIDVLSPFVPVLCHCDWLFHVKVMSTSWRSPSRPCVAFLDCVYLVLFLALSLSPGNFLVSWWCDNSMLVSLLWRCLTVPSLLQLCLERTIFFLCCPRNPQNFSQSFNLNGVKTCFFLLSESPAFTAVCCYRPH